MKPYCIYKRTLPVIILILVVSAFTLNSCEKDFTPLFKKIDGKSDCPVVLVAGWESNGVSDVAKYWVNGKEIILSDGTKQARASSIFVSGNNVFVAGTDGGPVYWKNNIEIRLPISPSFHSSYYGTANSIFVSGNDVYVAGQRGDYQIFAVYWKNGKEVILEEDVDGSSATSVFVSGKDIYFAGFHGKNAVYWKNGKEVKLTNITQPELKAMAISIYVYGKDIYVAGIDRGMAVYWKNGEKIILNDKKEISSQARSIFVSCNNVYIAGSIYSTTPPANAVYWKNGTEMILPSSTLNSAFANSIFVLNNDVYVAGHLNGIPRGAVYWKNGTEVLLTDRRRNACAESIFVK